MSDRFCEIEASEVRFFSVMDEANFFRWLDNIRCVESYKGHLRTLRIILSIEKIDEEATRELLSLFHRYNLDMSSLIVLDLEEQAAWFRDKRAFWYSKIFSEH